jgi:GNAT superfamily N-acetyltransferase
VEHLYDQVASLQKSVGKTPGQRDGMASSPIKSSSWERIVEDPRPGRRIVNTLGFFIQATVGHILPHAPAQTESKSTCLRAICKLAQIAKWLLPISEVYLVLRKDLNSLLSSYSTRIPVEILIASEREVEEAALLRDSNERLMAIYRSRWRRGHKCFVAKSGAKVIASNWLIFGAEVDNADFTVVCDGEVVCSDAYTAPSWRGNGIHTGLLSRMLQWARDAGYQVAYTELSAFVRNSWVTHERLGWKVVQLAVRIRLAGAKRESVLVFGRSSHPLRGMFLHSGERDIVLSRILNSGEHIVFPLKLFKTQTGNLRGNAIVCIPGMHDPGHCVYGPDYIISRAGTYRALFTVSQELAEVVGDVVFDVYENRKAKSVLAEAQFDTGARSEPVALEFFAKKGYSIELRVYWRGKSRLRVREIRLERRM